jgi:GNAT superfamily N-acetyltransferase
MVMVDQAQQGKGIAKAMFAALPDHLRAGYPDATEAYLTVNCNNPRARHGYLTGGWGDTGDLYLDGGYGPQHVMRLSLR